MTREGGKRERTQVPGQDACLKGDAAPAHDRRRSLLMGGERVSGLGGVPGVEKAPPDAPLPMRTGRERHRMWRELSADELYLGNPDHQRTRDRSWTVIVVCLVLVPLAVLAATLLPSGLVVVGSTIPHDFAWWRQALESNVAAFARYLSGGAEANGIGSVFWRYCTVAMAGAGLAAAGAVSQGTLKNYLASPSTLGVVSGGTLGAVLYVLVFQLDDAGLFMSASEYRASLEALDPAAFLLQAFGRQAFSLVGCIVVTVLVLGVSYVAGRGSFSKVALVIIGQVVASVAAAVVGLVRYYLTYAGNEGQLTLVTQLSNGVFADAITPWYFLVVAVPVGLCLAVLLLGRRRLNLLSFSDEEARSMGMATASSRVIALLLVAVVTACVVSLCGSIGFVGFMVPHLVRRLVGADFKYLLPASAVMGALFLVVAYHLMTLCNLLNGALGLFTTVVGMAFFLACLVAQRRRGNASWN